MKYFYLIIVAILLYLVLSHGDSFAKIVAALGGTAIKGAAVLQGRNVVGVTS